MAGRHPPHFIVEKNQAGDLEFLFSDQLVEQRSWRHSRQSSTARNAEGLAFRDVYRPLHIVDDVAPALVPDERIVGTSAVYEYGHVPDPGLRRSFDLLSANPRVRLWLIEWGQPIAYTWTANGIARELYLYHVQAADFWEQYKGPLPGSIPFGTAGTLEYAPTLWVDGVKVVDFTRVDQPTWDGGDPAPGAAWWLDGGQRIKLGDIPPIRVTVQARILPLWRVKVDVGRDGPVSTRGRQPGLERRTIALTEAQD